MGARTRQWKALMRKNFIGWKRQPGCSFFEICCPCFVMITMVLLRNLIDVEVFDFSALAKVRQPTVPGLSWDSTSSTWSAKDFAKLSTDLDGFFEYSQYPNATYYAIEPTYNIQSDVQGPLYFIPSDCLKSNSF